MAMRDQPAPERRFPDDFLFGCASAAHQVEGGLDNDWTAFEDAHPDRIKDGSRSGIACDHYNRYREDFNTLGALGQNAHRFSVEWSRIEPHEGHFDIGELRHYRDVVRACHAAGMQPCVTLHHFTLPRWLAEQGGILNPRTPRLFARFAAAVAEVLVDDVEWWITINEPIVVAILGYLNGEWPPMHTSLPDAMRAFAQLLRMHAAAAQALRKVANRHGASVRVSIAHHERRLVPENPSSVANRVLAMLPDYLFNRWFLDSCSSGRVLPPVGWGQSVPGLKDSLDYIGVNYYTRDRVRVSRSSSRTLFVDPVEPTEGPLSTFKWRIDPEGLRIAVGDLWHRFHLPLLITENGVADENDELRGEYIIDHCNAMLDALEDGVDLRGYFHWTAMDNFEWAEGYGQRFGLFSVDRATMARTAKPSALIFAEICGTGHVPVADRRPA